MVLDSSEGRTKSIILFHLLTFAGYSFGDSFGWLLAIFLNLKTQLQKKKKRHNYISVWQITGLAGTSEVMIPLSAHRMDCIWPSLDIWVSIMCLKIEAPVGHMTKVETPVEPDVSMFCSPCPKAPLEKNLSVQNFAYLRYAILKMWLISTL